MANFRKCWCVFLGGRRKIPNSQPKFLFVNSENFSAKKKNTPKVSKVRHVGSQVHQKLFKSTRILSDKQNLKLGTPIEIATWRQQNQVICGSGLVHACLGSSEEIGCLSSNVHNFRSFASTELIFCLNRSRIRQAFRKSKSQREFCAPSGAVLCRLPSVSCLFLLVNSGFADTARGGMMPSSAPLPGDPSPQTVVDYVDAPLCGDVPSVQLFKPGADVACNSYSGSFALEDTFMLGEEDTMTRTPNSTALTHHRA